MKETSKCYKFRKERGDFEKYLKGRGIDIGAGDDLLTVENGSVERWDTEHGDATLMATVPGGCYDFVYSSHCLEHLQDVNRALTNWVRILSPSGYLYVVVPDFGLYEKFCFPSRFNADHKSTFSTWLSPHIVERKSHYWLGDIFDILRPFGVVLHSADVECFGYDFSERPEIDQTIGSAVAQICIIGQKP